jgi:transcriptional regulator with XRE-family HTH domain
MKTIKEGKLTEPHNYADYIDPDYLMVLRVGRGKTRREMAELINIQPYSYARMEGHKAFKLTLGIARLRKICHYLALDPLELCELFRYKWIPEMELKMFRRACKEAGENPAQVLRILMKHYHKAVLKEK